jgi:methyl-accepting chemotaxis protein
MQKTLLYAAILLGAAAFLGMLKLMNDMTAHMARMTDQVAVMSRDLGRMQAQMETLVEEVSGIQASVGHMAPLAEDVHALRESVGSMAGVIHRGSEQIERLNPMDMLQQVMPPQRR